MLVNGVLTAFPQKYLVSASGMAGLGSANAIRTRQVTKRFYLCGDEVSDTTKGLGLLAPWVAPSAPTTRPSWSCASWRGSWTPDPQERRNYYANIGQAHPRRP